MSRNSQPQRGRNGINGRCCVFQPFDKGAHDKRYADILDPAIRDAGFDPYRVDRDDSAVILIETLHDEIRSSAACVADISTNNPNVLYELGFAIALNKPVVIICSTAAAERFPFDVRHRAIVEYAPESPSDFKKLQSDITQRLKALLKRETEIHNIVTAPPQKGTQGVKPYEVTTLGLIMANRSSAESGVSIYSIKLDMQRAGFNDLASGIALTSLVKRSFVSFREESDFNESHTVYNLTQEGEDWLLENQEQLQLTLEESASAELLREVGSKNEISDDNVPF
jgi:nucleoside 2-deoxyribosyltransferase